MHISHCVLFHLDSLNAVLLLLLILLYYYYYYYYYYLHETPTYQQPFDIRYLMCICCTMCVLLFLL